MLSGLIPPSMLLLTRSVVGMGAVERSLYVFQAACIRFRWPRVNLSKEGGCRHVTLDVSTHQAQMRARTRATDTSHRQDLQSELRSHARRLQQS